MNEELQAIKARIRRITSTLEDELGLSGWLAIEHHFSAGYGEGDDIPSASTQPAWEMRRTTITWYLATCATHSDDELERVALHEYVHTLIAPIASFAPTKQVNVKLEELAVESLAPRHPSRSQEVTPNQPNPGGEAKGATMEPFHARPLVYVAAPYTRPDPVENTHLAVKTATELQDTGLVTCVVPHLNLVWHLVAPQPPDYWYEYDYAILTRCDALLRLPGDSTGADAEVAFAVERGIRVFTDRDHLLSWAFIRQTEMEPC